MSVIIGASKCLSADGGSSVGIECRHVARPPHGIIIRDQGEVYALLRCIGRLPELALSSGMSGTVRRPLIWRSVKEAW